MKKAIKLILMFGVLGSLLLLHYKSNYAEENNDSLKDKLLLNYRAYSLSSFNASKDKMVHYAEDLYQKDLAEKTGVRPSTISALCTGAAKHVPVDVLDKICEALNCQPGDLMEYIPTQREDVESNA